MSRDFTKSRRVGQPRSEWCKGRPAPKPELYLAAGEGGHSPYSRARAILSARSNSSTLERARDPTKRVSCTLRRLTRLSHRIQLSCFKPSSIPTETWVENPCPRVSIGAQTTVGNL